MVASSQQLLKNAAILASAIYLTTSKLIDSFSPGDMDTTEVQDLDKMLEDAQEAIESVQDVIGMSIQFAKDLAYTIVPVKKSAHEQLVEKIKARQSEMTKNPVEKVNPASPISVSTQKYKTALMEVKSEKDETPDERPRPSNR